MTKTKQYTAQEMRDMAENIIMLEDDWIEDAAHMLRQSADAERRARDPQVAEARVERRLMEEDFAYRLCRRAAGVVFALPKEAAR